MRKNLIRALRIEITSKKGYLNRAHGHGKPLLGFLLIAGLLLLLSSPLVEGDAKYFYATGETIWFGSRSNAFPKCAELDDDYACFWIEGASETVDVAIKWAGVRLTKLTLEMKVKWSEVGGPDSIGIFFYNNTASDWTSLYLLDGSQSDWITLSFDVTGHIYNNSMPTIRFVGDSLGGGSSLGILVEYIWFVDELFTLRDRIDDLEKELEEVERRLNDLDTGYTDYTPNEPHIPYGARDYLDDTGNVLIDPFATWIYEIVDQQGSASSNAHWLPYPTSASDVDVLSDRIEWSFASGTQIWINDTTPSIIFSTTDTGYESWDIFAKNITNAGSNLTFEMAGDNTVSTRFVRVKIVNSFDWSVNTETQLHSTTVSLDNNWGLDARQLQVFVASDPDTTIDQSTVEIRDNVNDITLESGINYIVTASGFLWQIQHFNSSDQVSYTIRYNIYTPATEVLEISCQVAGPRVTTAFWRNTKYQFTTASCYNPNTFDSTGRIVLDWSLIQEDIDFDGLVILDATGKRYTDIYPLTNKKIAVEDVFIPMSETVIFDLYFRTIPSEFDLGRWFVQYGFWIPALAFAAAIISTVPLMAKEKFQEGTNIRLDKDRRKMLRRLALSFLFVFVGTLIAWTFAVALYQPT